MKKRILAFDIGDSWIGVAHTDAEQILCVPYETWKSTEFKIKLTNYLSKNDVEAIVFGLPITMSGGHSDQTKKVTALYEIIKNEFSNYNFYLQDERLSSQFSQKFINKKKGSKHTDHAISAFIILENFMMKKRNY
jgi:putative transcription antitermination factor YqgF